jgi:hypothetical protein
MSANGRWSSSDVAVIAAPGKETGIREAKGLFVVAAHCPEFMRTIPLPRHKKNPDTGDSSAEDHIFGSCAYVLRYNTGPGVRFYRL